MNPWNDLKENQPAIGQKVVVADRHKNIYIAHLIVPPSGVKLWVVQGADRETYALHTFSWWMEVPNVN